VVQLKDAGRGRSRVSLKGRERASLCWSQSQEDSNGPSSALKETDILGTWTLTAGAGTGSRQCGVIPSLLLPFVSGGVDLGDGRLQFVDPWYFASNPSQNYGAFAGQISTQDGSAHIQLNRTRSEVVEFRVEQHLEALKDRLGALGSVTRNVTRDEAVAESEAPASMDLQAGEDVPEWARRDSNARPLAPEASALSN
jgi:hypothetical protein